MSRASQEGEVMAGTCRKILSGLNEFQDFRLFKCAVKDDDALVDTRPATAPRATNAIALPVFKPRDFIGTGERNHDASKIGGGLGGSCLP
jgi:hypothetical protein